MHWYFIIFCRQRICLKHPKRLWKKNCDQPTGSNITAFYLPYVASTINHELRSASTSASAFRPSSLKMRGQNAKRIAHILWTLYTKHTFNLIIIILYPFLLFIKKKKDLCALEPVFWWPRPVNDDLQKRK